MTETLYAMALTRIPRMSLSNINMLYTTLGSATAVYEHRNSIRDVLPDATERLASALRGMDEALKRAETELEFAQKKHIRCLTMQDADYPQRLLECPDAPIVLYFCGNANLNASRIINIIGTRHCTEYGRDICRNFIADLQRHHPDTLIVSGLAYGIDINAHRAALDSGMQTVGVLAHGLDRIYPSVHRTTAASMAHQGGLLTEYMSQTAPDKINFVRRNRIVAGMCDATIVVESAAKGGALITAELAESYHRDVFAFPGRIYDQYSEGCNRLIKAIYHLLTLQTFITAGEMEVKAWTFRKGWKAPQCAGVIHTDFEKGFIRAEVIKYDDYIKYGSEAAVREAGKMGVEGKEYVVQDGDIMHFRFNV